MSLAQVERLRKDERELNNRIYRLKKQGKDNLVRKLTIKRGFLKQSISAVSYTHLTLPTKRIV